MTDTVHTWRTVYIYDSTLNSSSNNSCIKKITTHILCAVTFSPRKSCQLWDNVEIYVRAAQATYDNIMRRMGIARWMTKAIQTHGIRICDTYCLSTATRVQRKNTNVTFTYIACLFKYIGVCYKERMLQRTVFVDKIRMLQRKQMLQRSRRNTIGRRSKRVPSRFDQSVSHHLCYRL